MTTFKKVLLWIILGLILAVGIFVYIRFFFVFGDGVKAGELNQITYKGYVWKTYEGRLIQAGFKGSVPKTGGTATIQSYIFDFSVADEEIANELMIQMAHRGDYRVINKWLAHCGEAFEW